MQKRRRFEQEKSLKDRLITFADEARQKAELLAAGAARDQLLKKADLADTEAHLDDWINSPGLQPPK